MDDTNPNPVSSILFGLLVFGFLLAVGLGFIPVNLTRIIKDETDRLFAEILMLRILPLFTCLLIISVVVSGLIGWLPPRSAIRAVMKFGILLIGAAAVALRMIIIGAGSKFGDEWYWHIVTGGMLVIFVGSLIICRLAMTKALADAGEDKII